MGPVIAPLLFWAKDAPSTRRKEINTIRNRRMKQILLLR
jgi:hypothetical protein